MTRKARFTEGDVTRIMRAAKRSGFERFRILIDAEGEITVDISPTNLAHSGAELWTDDDI